MSIERAAYSLTNRRANTEDFGFYSNYEKTNSALTIFGISAPSFSNFNTFIKDKKGGFKKNRNTSKSSISQLNSIQSSIKAQNSKSVRVNRKFIRRLRRFELNSESKKVENFVKISVFGGYSKGSVFKRFSIIKSRNEKPIPILLSNSLQTARSLQD
jgi:hypothetical protein